MANAIPTDYCGIRMRSRLEAQWAAFFDLMGWKWSYEPFDLRGYIPDFVIDAIEPTLFEIKPELHVDGLSQHADKIVESGWEGPYVILGASLFHRGDFEQDLEERWASIPVLGAGHMTSKLSYDAGVKDRRNRGRNLTEKPWIDSASDVYEIDLHFCSACRRFYFSECLPDCAFCGYRWQKGDSGGDDGLILSAFSTAKNRVQWKGAFGA